MLQVGKASSWSTIQEHLLTDVVIGPALAGSRAMG